MNDYCRQVSKTDEIGIQQRHAVCHVIEQIIEFCIEVEYGNRHITKQKNKGDGLVFQDAHHKKRKAENKDQGWQTDDQEIFQVCQPVNRHILSDQVKNKRFRKNNQVQDNKNDQVPDGFSGHIFAVRHRAYVNYISGIQFFIAFQKIRSQKYGNDRLNCIQHQEVDIRNCRGNCLHIPILTLIHGQNSHVEEEQNDHGQQSENPEKPTAQQCGYFIFGN